jgi:hypothetical protein
MITYFNNKNDVENPSWMSIVDLVQLIKVDVDIAQKISEVRFAHLNYSKQEKDEIKGNLPGFITSGEFTARNNKSCLNYSARIVIDIDHLQGPELSKLKSNVMNDKTVLMAFISPSGDGLKIIHQLECPEIEKDEWQDFHKQAFNLLKKIIRNSIR